MSVVQIGEGFYAPVRRCDLVDLEEVGRDMNRAEIRADDHRGTDFDKEFPVDEYLQVKLVLVEDDDIAA